MHKRIQFPAPPKDNYEGWELNLKNTSISRNRVSTVFFWLEGLGYKEKEAFMGLYLNIIFLSLWNVCFVTDSGDSICNSSSLPAKHLSGLTSSDNFGTQIKTVC